MKIKNKLFVLLFNWQNRREEIIFNVFLDKIVDENAYVYVDCNRHTCRWDRGELWLEMMVDELLNVQMNPECMDPKDDVLRPLSASIIWVKNFEVVTKLETFTKLNKLRFIMTKSITKNNQTNKQKQN